MTKKIFRSIVIVATAVLLASITIILGILYEYFGMVQTNQLKTELTLAAKAVEEGGLEYLSDLDTGDCRLTWVAADGTVLYDSKTDSATMENHAEREEIRKALLENEGESTRYSATLTEETVYRAKKLTDGTVLRISTSHLTVPVLFLTMLQPIIIIFVLALILSGFLAHGIAKRIVKPLENLNFDQPSENSPYEELKPVLSYMEIQRKQIKRQTSELETRKHEFNAVTDNLDEGLVMLNAKGEILSINPAAIRFFHLQENCQGQSFGTFDENNDIEKAICTANERGKSELRLSRNSREYEISINRIDSDSHINGVVLLILDITEKTLAEQNRREFTANVSHELKTPLQSIMGSAELLESGMVKPEDVPRFVGHIRSESARLVTLIDDIIRLSRLDENNILPFEDVDVFKQAKQDMAPLYDLAAEKDISLTLEGETAIAIGTQSLFHEIITNLCDNAIKYTPAKGTVKVSVENREKIVVLTVSDTGIGIPEEHLSRIFERFYRVDKSHSKESGGTGLGLSIVKHAVQYLNGTIDVKSKVGKGTTFTVCFPKKSE